MLYLTVPASAGLLVLRTPVIETLLQRGAFTQASTEAVAFALQFYALGLFAHATVEIVTRAFYALHDTRTPVAIGLSAMVINILLSLILIRPLSFGGLALANTMATILEMAVLMWLMHRRLGSLDARRLVNSVVRIGLAAGLMAATLFSFARGRPAADPLLITVGGVSIGTVLYVGVTFLVGSDEISAVLRVAQRRPLRSEA